jgi:hypothetical protein
MKSNWIAFYEGNEIQIRNRWFRGEMYYNGKLLDSRISFLSFKLRGSAVAKNGENHIVKANLWGPISINCLLFVNGIKVKVLSS